MAIPVGGLATGIDTNSLISQLMAVERQPITLLETRKLKFQALSASFQDLNSKLSTLKTRAEAVKNPAEFFSRSATSSDETVATATAAPGEARGTYTITTTQLARGSIVAAATTKGSLTDVVATESGNLEFRLGAGGALVSVAVDAATTLEQLVAAINDKNAGVRATTINSGTSASPAWKLTLTSTGTGAASDIVLVTDGTSLGLDSTQTALDAAFSVTGLGDFTRATNTFSDVLEGVTVTLKAGSGSTDLSISFDRSGTQGRLQAVLDAYNTAVNAIDAQSAGTFTSAGKFTPGAFTGDVVPRQIRQGLAASVATRLEGAYRSLADIGVTTQKNGTLTLDSARFEAAFTENPEGVSTLLAGTATTDGIADLILAKAEAATRSLTGTIAARQDGISSSIRSLQKQIDSATARMEVTERTLRARFVALEVAVSQINSSGSALLAELGRLDMYNLNS